MSKTKIKLKTAKENELIVTVQKTDAREAWAEANKNKVYRTPLKNHDIVPIYQAIVWKRWGVHVQHSLADIYHKDYFNRGINSLSVGDEIEVFTNNKEDFARIIFIVAKVDKENHIVRVVEFMAIKLKQSEFKD